MGINVKSTAEEIIKVYFYRKNLSATPPLQVSAAPRNEIIWKAE
tara:strand:- start:255 stop:386 length:132 start_codon:yes stop_codon:yes gene_type:complete